MELPCPFAIDFLGFMLLQEPTVVIFNKRLWFQYIVKGFKRDLALANVTCEFCIV